MRQIIYSGMMDGLVIERCTRHEEYNMVKHWHPEVEFQYFLSGKRLFFIESKVYMCKPGSLVIVDSNQVHNTASDKELFHDRVLLSFEKEKFQKILEDMGFDMDEFFSLFNGLIQIPETDRSYLEWLLMDLANEVKKKKPMYQLSVQVRVTELFVYLTRLKTSGPREKKVVNTNEVDELVNKVTLYIRDAYKTAGSLQDIAKYFYLDKSYLSRIFKRSTGYTVSEFTNIRRIQQSQKLLEDTDWTIAKVAEEVGYQNLTYYNRVFKKYIETSPLQYRKKKIAYRKSLREKNNN